jgi:hypothetical protein
MGAKSKQSNSGELYNNQLNDIWCSIALPSTSFVGIYLFRLHLFFEAILSLLCIVVQPVF